MWLEWCSFHHGSRFIYHPVVNCVLHIAITVSVHFHQYLNFQVHVTVTGYNYSSSLMHSSTVSLRLGFSMAAATRSLSLICLFTSASVLWLPSLTKMSSFTVPGTSTLSSFVLESKVRNYCKFKIHLIHKPISVARWQCGTVGTNSICATNLSPALLIG